jgi:Asp-tRNA(Asn)/Glu-tRNA(Gln) amidotransferase B subunit
MRPPAPDLDALVGDAVSRARAMNGRSPGTQLRWAVGQVIPRTLGHADPREVQRRLEDRLTTISVGAAR